MAPLAHHLARTAGPCLVVLAVAASVAACGTARPRQPGCDLVSAPEAGRDAYPVTVFTNDLPSGEAFLAEIGERGYVNEGSEVLHDPNDSFNVKWGAAPLAYVLELANMVEARYGRRPRLLHVFGDDDADIFLNVPLGLPLEEPAGDDDVDRASLHIVVFARDPAIGEAVLERLAGMGYTNPENTIQDHPNPEFNIKWGAAPPALVDEIVTYLEQTFRTPFTRRHEFGEGDPDFFINLPVEGI